MIWLERQQVVSDYSLNFNLRPYRAFLEMHRKLSH